MAETTVRTVKVKVNGQCLSTSEVLTVNGTVNMIVCEIETDNWWTAFPAIIAIFKNDNDGREYIADVINGRCTVPHEVLRKAGNILMAIKGENETQIERSETKVIAVQKRTLQDGANSIDPSPNQYAEYIERAGEAIQEYFDEHKSEFKGDPGEPGEPGPPGDPGEPGPPGPEYDDTEIRSEIASIQQELNDKMEFYKVVLEGSPVKFWHEGVVQNYADLEAKYRDDKYFLYAEYESVTFIPSLPPDEDPVHPENVIEFSATWLYEGVQHITSIKINELEQIKIEEFECASSDDLNDVKKDLSQVSESMMEISDYIFDNADKPTDIRNIYGITVAEGWNASDSSSSIAMSKNASFDTFYFVSEDDHDIFVNTVSAPYFAIVYGNNYTSKVETETTIRLYTDASVRLRKSENNLPTESNKLHIARGTAVAFTITKGYAQDIYGTISGLKVKDDFKREIIESIPSNKNPKLRYVTGTIEGNANEALYIYMPSRVGYIRYSFVHTVEPSINADVWRIHNAYAVDEQFNDRFVLTDSGAEWEMAIRSGTNIDFSGGYAHGDEVKTAITFIVDGVVTDITSLTSLTNFERLEIVQNSNVFEPSDNTTIFAVHGSNHIFDYKNYDHLQIMQTVRYTRPYNMLYCYLAMFPPLKTVTDHYIDDIDFKDNAIVSGTKVIEKCRSVIIKSDNVGFIARFSIPKTVVTDNLKNNDSFKMLDNGGGAYNKCYYTLCTECTTKANEVWKTQTNYNLQMVK